MYGQVTFAFKSPMRGASERTEGPRGPEVQDELSNMEFC